MALGRGAKDVVYRAMGKIKYVGAKIKNAYVKKHSATQERINKYGRSQVGG